MCAALLGSRNEGRGPQTCPLQACVGPARALGSTRAGCPLCHGHGASWESSLPVRTGPPSSQHYYSYWEASPAPRERVRRARGRGSAGGTHQYLEPVVPQGRSCADGCFTRPQRSSHGSWRPDPGAHAGHVQLPLAPRALTRPPAGQGHLQLMWEVPVRGPQRPAAGITRRPWGPRGARAMAPQSLDLTRSPQKPPQYPARALPGLPGGGQQALQPLMPSGPAASDPEQHPADGVSRPPAPLSPPPLTQPVPACRG